MSEELSQPISIEKTHFQITIGVMVSLIVFLAGVAYNFGAKVQEQNGQIEKLQEQIGDLQSQISSLRTDIKESNVKNSQLDIRLTVIETKLANIDEGVKDIKLYLQNNGK